MQDHPEAIFRGLEAELNLQLDWQDQDRKTILYWQQKVQSLGLSVKLS